MGPEIRRIPDPPHGKQGPVAPCRSPGDLRELFQIRGNVREERCPGRIRSVVTLRMRNGTSQSPFRPRLSRQPIVPRPPCVRAASPHHRKLGAGYAALPQMAGRRVGCACIWSPLATGPAAPSPLRPYARAYAYRGLRAFASLSMARSVGIFILSFDRTPLSNVFKILIRPDTERKAKRAITVAQIIIAGIVSIALAISGFGVGA